MGRPPKLTPAVQEAVVTVLRNTGCSRAQAARHVEVDVSTMARWVLRNARFRAAVEKAEIDYDLGLLARARAHATRDGKTAQWLIEHHPRLRAEWSTQAEVGVTVTGPDGLALKVEHTHGLGAGTADALAQLTALASTLDVMVRVGLVGPVGGRGEASPRLVGPADDSEVDEVHPA